MALTPEQYNTVAAYLSGDISEAEKKALINWCAASTENRLLFREAEIIWTSSKQLTLADADTETEWARLARKIESDNSERKTISLWRSSGMLLKVAASIILLLSFSYLLFWKSNPEDAVYEDEVVAEKPEITISSGNAVAMLYLPDSSLVWLNVNSTLAYKENFSEDRKITLSGEAYFKVRSDKRYPFAVHTKHSTATVLGTSFNVKENSDGVILTVADGHVQFASNDSSQQNTITVHAHETSLWKTNEKVRKQKVTSQEFAQWRKRNNPVYTDELNHPEKFIHVNYSWRINKINQSVLEGSIQNNATLASYENIIMRISYINKKGVLRHTDIAIKEKLGNRKSNPFQKRLMDIFSETKSMDIKIISARGS